MNQNKIVEKANQIGENLGLNEQETLELALFEFIKNHSKEVEEDDRHYFFHLREGQWYKTKDDKYVKWEKNGLLGYKAELIEVFSDKTIYQKKAGLPSTFHRFIGDMQKLPLDFSIKKTGIVSVSIGEGTIDENLYESEKILLTEYIIQYGVNRKSRRYHTDQGKEAVLLDWGIHEAI